MIEVRTSRPPEAACGAIAVAGGRGSGLRVEFGHYDGLEIRLGRYALTRLGPTWIQRRFTGMVRADGAGAIVRGTVDWEPGFALRIALALPLAVLILGGALYALSQTLGDPIPGLLGVAFGLAFVVMYSSALLFRRQIHEDDEKRIRAFLEDALE